MLIAVLATLQGLTPAAVPSGGLAVERPVVEVSLTATPRRLEIVPGKFVDAYAYNGTVPGPTLEFREGDRVRIRFTNDLPVATTVHWHGLHLPFEADGSPFHPVPPGTSYDYEFTIRPGTAGTYWYHPHPNHETARQVGRGLAGAVIVRADDDPLASLPERVLVLTDNRLTDDGRLDFPDPASLAGLADQENGREGPLLLVNGEQLPTLTIRPGELQRWRIVNASAARIYRLSIPGQSLTWVGTDGGLFERPVTSDSLLIAPSERIEVLVRGHGPEGHEVQLLTLPYDRYIPQTRPADWNTAHPLLTLRTAGEPVTTPPVAPDRLRVVEPIDEASATATRVMALSQGMINGRKMDMDRADVTAELGATEIWQVENLVGMDHPFHLHGFRFQVLDRNGVPEPFRAWKDVVNVPEHETARFIVQYEAYPGMWMFHCHILDHEDHGMMGILQVNPGEIDARN